MGHTNPRQCSRCGQSAWALAQEEKALEVLMTVAEHEHRCAQVAKKTNSTWPVPAMV